MESKSICKKNQNIMSDTKKYTLNNFKIINSYYEKKEIIKFFL